MMGDLTIFCGFGFVVHNLFILLSILLSLYQIVAPFIQLSNGRFSFDIAYSHIQLQVKTVTSLTIFVQASSHSYSTVNIASFAGRFFSKRTEGKKRGLVIIAYERACFDCKFIAK